MDREDIQAKVMWRPQWGKATLMTRFRHQINKHFNLALSNYHQLYKWSCENYRLLPVCLFETDLCKTGVGYVK